MAYGDSQEEQIYGIGSSGVFMGPIIIVGT